MDRAIIVGLDGSPESRAAAEWAAREAQLRILPLKLVHVWELVSEPLAQAPMLGGETHQHWSDEIPRESAEGLLLRHPGLAVTAEHVAGRPSEVLCEAAKAAELLVLGSRGLSGVGGFLVGSVGLAVVAHAECPVVLVRVGEQAADEHEKDPTGIPSAATRYRPVLLGLDLDNLDASMIDFAFDAAARRESVLRVVHAWELPTYFDFYGEDADTEWCVEVSRKKATELTEALRAWRQKHPRVDVVEEVRWGGRAGHLIDESREASLVVVGRRIRRHPFGMHIGPVTHAVLHHATAPVAVVAHD
ncbi:stress-inducible protein [Streptomyces sp. AS58]|uniref:universal stress protein n=1 Tax=Streptomyces sp. AS58 TaxID=1519489 RepID=UPI0006AE89AD|nr:universal stress protein [Streptomyces sp. AS58]KOV60844.1 stress-inducible protein [Streptomyces sp. AS58]